MPAIESRLSAIAALGSIPMTPIERDTLHEGACALTEFRAFAVAVVERDRARCDANVGTCYWCRRLTHSGDAWNCTNLDCLVVAARSALSKYPATEDRPDAL